MHRFALVLAAAGVAAAMPARAADMTPTFAALEAKWAKAAVAKDFATIDGIVADDWRGQDPGGKPTTKAAYTGDIKSGRMTIAAMTTRDVTARVFGDIAVVQGADDEKSSYDGKDTSGAYTWTDVFQKRGGKWVAVASQVTMTMK